LRVKLSVYLVDLSFVLFLFAILLSVLLLLTAADYPCDIFKLFFFPVIIWVPRRVSAKKPKLLTFREPLDSSRFLWLGSCCLFICFVFWVVFFVLFAFVLCLMCQSSQCHWIVFFVVAPFVFSIVYIYQYTLKREVYGIQHV